MSNIQTYCANGREYLLAEVPEDANSFVILPILWFAPPESTIVRYQRGSEHEWYSLKVTGNWSIIGKASELSEQQAAELVERNPDSYRNYDLPFGLQTAKESLSSLLSSLGMGEGNTLILKRQ